MAGSIRRIRQGTHDEVGNNRKNTADMTDDLTMALQHDTPRFTKIGRGRMLYFARVNFYMSHTLVTYSQRCGFTCSGKAQMLWRYTKAKRCTCRTCPTRRLLQRALLCTPRISAWEEGRHQGFKVRPSGLDAAAARCSVSETCTLPTTFAALVPSPWCSWGDWDRLPWLVGPTARGASLFDCQSPVMAFQSI